MQGNNHGGKQTQGLHGEAMSNWYVMQVNTGREYSIQAQALRMISRTDLPQVIVPTYSARFKLQGKWTERKQLLFPGYVFLITEDIERVIAQLQKIVGMTKMLKKGETIQPISNEEEATITRLIDGNANANISEGLIEGNKIIVTEGPLKGMESQIVKVDRHKRLAWISLEMFGREQSMCIGLEIVKKISG